jgi:hypothetical protein
VPNLSEAVSYLLKILRSGDLLIVLTAGDANQICPWILNELEQSKRGENS